MNADEDVDVAIVGAGVAGCYLAARLSALDPRTTKLAPLAAARPDGKLAIRVYDASARVGGRIATVWMRTLPTIATELGAEGYMLPPSPPAQYTGHVLTNALARWLEPADGHGLRSAVRTAPRQLVRALRWGPAVAARLGRANAGRRGHDTDPEPLPPGNLNNPFYLRGQQFPAGELGDPGVLPYALSPAELDALATPASLVGYASDCVIPGATSMSQVAWEELRRIAEWKGRPLWDQEFGAVVDDLVRDGLMTAGARDLLFDLECANRTLRHFNAVEGMANALCNAYAGLETVFFPEGFVSIINGLVRRFLAQEPQGIRRGHALADIAQADDGSLDLRFEGRVEGIDAPGRPEFARVRARVLILAMPERPIEGLLGSPVFQGERARTFREDLPAVAADPIVRHYGSYPSPWWLEQGVTGGAGITTEPIRVTYAMGTEGEQPGDPARDRGNSLFLISFRQTDDAADVDHQAQIARLYGRPEIPGTQEEVKKLWSTHDPLYGGAVHRWRPGYKSWEVKRRMLAPIPGVPLHVCGEAYSDVQGWVEGALGTCDRLLAQEWKIGPL